MQSHRAIRRIAIFDCEGAATSGISGVSSDRDDCTFDDPSIDRSTFYVLKSYCLFERGEYEGCIVAE